MQDTRNTARLRSYGAHARPTFSDCAMRYVAQSQGKRSIDVIKLHVRMLESYVGKLQPHQIHDATWSLSSRIGRPGA
jgi:hypothetical protein